jgi:hypothetical protein
LAIPLSPGEDWPSGKSPAALRQLRSCRHSGAAEPLNETGCRLATSVGGVLTGRGADIVIIDDPLKPEEALSQAQRQMANEWYDHTLYSRLNGVRLRQRGCPSP